MADRPFVTMRWLARACQLILIGLASAFGQSTDSSYVRHSSPEVFSFDELVLLGADKVDSSLAEKIEHITTTPFLSNEAYYRGAKPQLPAIRELGPGLRMVFWNIERGSHLGDILTLFGKKDEFLKQAQGRHTAAPLRAGDQGTEKPETPVTVDLNGLRSEVEALQSVDLVVLNEVDWGMPRTEYREVVRELGQALNMNWAYGVEFVEIDPVVLGLEKFEGVEDEAARTALLAQTKADTKRLRALHGTAILSRYPIRSASLRPIEPRAYDWYTAEKKLRPVEKGIRVGARVIGENMQREMRKGGRTLLMVDLDVPYLPEGRLTVVSPHLENRAKPKQRQRQMEFVLAAIKGVRNPVIVAGDLNTTGSDGEAFRLEKELYKKYTEADTWVNLGIKAVTGVGLAYDLFQTGFKFTRNVSDPTVQGVPFFAPNKERNLFANLEDFRFEDGTVFDFRGDAEHTSNGQSGTLANSNQRAGKGFAHTYQFVINVGAAGKYKLDWIFVKSYLESPRSPGGPRAFAPHFARTLTNINIALDHQLSDHNPMTADLPFQEPKRR
jgi:endonuclease/exonuclease/phosphatase family metal-dependent hydrolase